MTRKTQEVIRKIVPYISVLIIAALVVLGVWLFAGKDEPEDKPTEPSRTETAAPTESTEPATTEAPTESTTEAPPTVSEEDAEKVGELIGKYYAAKIADDADTLNQIVDTDTPYDAASLSNETQFIAKYDHFTTYAVPGISDNDFIVYVKYDIFFKGIQTGAPALNHFVCVKDGENYTIYNKEISDELRAYLEETEKSEAVAFLKQQVEEELEAACQADEDLKYLMDMLNGGTGKQTSAAGN